MVTVTCDMAGLDEDVGCSTVIGLQHGADGLDGSIEPARNFAIGRFECFRMRSRGIQFGGELRTIGAKRMQLLSDRLSVIVGLAAALDCPFQRIERQHQAFGG